MKHPKLEEFNQFWIDNSREEVPPVPQKPNDMNITMQECMRMKNPKLYQDLFSISVDSGRLPADLEMRLRNNAVWVEDADRLRKYGWEAKAQDIEKAREEFEQSQLQKKIEESQQRQAEQEKTRQAWQNMSPIEKMAVTPLSPDQIARNRQRYGVGQ